MKRKLRLLLQWITGGPPVPEHNPYDPVCIDHRSDRMYRSTAWCAICRRTRADH